MSVCKQASDFLLGIRKDFLAGVIFKGAEESSSEEFRLGEVGGVPDRKNDMLEALKAGKSFVLEESWEATDVSRPLKSPDVITAPLDQGEGEEVGRRQTPVGIEGWDEGM